MLKEHLTILVVHGRGFKPGEGAYAEITYEALRAGLERDYPDSLPAFDTINLEFAYYGDLANACLEAAGQEYDEVLDIGDRRNALMALRDIKARKRFGIRDYDRVKGKTALKEFAADIIAPLSVTVGLTMRLIRRGSPDVADYFEGPPEYRETLRARVRSKLKAMLDRGECVMLVSHGTGSIIAYDVLWQLSHDPQYAEKYRDRKIDHWVTMGAPLGNSTIKKRLLGRDRSKAERFPTNIITWQNLSAEDDYTCHDKSLANDYSRMMKEHHVSQIQDFRIFNLAVRYGTSNPHSSVGYFIHPRLSKIIADWIAENS